MFFVIIGLFLCGYWWLLKFFILSFLDFFKGFIFLYGDIGIIFMFGVLFIDWMVYYELCFYRIKYFFEILVNYIDLYYIIL